MTVAEGLRLDRAGEWWAVFDGEAPVRTPGGTALVSRHRELLEEVRVDIERYGRDPRAKTTTFSLQASYLDFGIPVRRSVLEENTFAIWPDDPFAGKIGPDRDGFRDALRTITLRQLMATMTAGHVLRSAVLGLAVVTTGVDLRPLATGSCGRFLAAQGEGRRGEPPPGRHVPTDMDEAYCASICCAGRVEDEREFHRRCALHPLLDKMRRWCAFPEEVEKR